MTKKTYQTIRAELDTVLLELQQPDIDVEQAVKLHDVGVKLADELKQRLTTIENSITTLPEAE